MSPLRPSPRWSALFLACLPLLSRAQVPENAPFGLESRTPWTTSRVHGTPEPPPPYTTERYLTNVPLKSPIYAKAEPGTRNLVVVLQGGEKDRPSRALRLEESATTAQAETLLEISHRLIYGLTFHPRFSENGQLFVFSNGTTGETERTNYVSRFQISRTAPYECDPASETLLLKWRSAGHDGGDLEFGRDGFLYISTGDGTSDSDGWDSGQTLTDLLGSVLRIDVDHPDAAQPYSIPKDNPFLNTPGARGEIWAYGLRNPWRMTADRRTGHVWVGNNGQDLWETAHFIRRGENYGWSVYEGSHPFYLNRRRGPTPIVAPTIEHHHSEFRSLTGGVVYSGDAFPELKGAYIYGDYATGRIWGARHDGTQLTWLQELATTPLQIAAFALSPAGELIVVDHGGGLHRLVRSQKRDNTRPFPQTLSETGVFEVTADQKPAPGVLAYSVNAPGWTDGARSEHFLAVPAGEKIEHTASRGWEMPDGTVLVQTLSLPLAGSKPGTWTRIETRLFTRQDRRWAGYSYRWNEAQTDATLVEARGAEATLHTRPAADVAEVRQQTWRFPSRTECLGCHSRAVNFTLSLNDAQMNRDHTYPGGVRDNQLRALSHAGFFTEPLTKKPSELQRLVDPYDPQQDLNQRARSYLHANCSVCHVEAGGGNARMLLEANIAADAMNLIGARPQHDTFGIQNAMLVAPGTPDQSVVVQRLSRRGRGQMPPLVSSVADTRAVSLFREWIQSLKPEHAVVHEWTLEELKNAPEQAASSRSYESGKSAFSTTGCIQCHRLNGDGGSVGPDLTGVSRRLKPMEIVESLIQPSKVIAPEYANAEIETVGGDKWIGRIESETPESITLRPAAAEDPITVRTADIRRRGLSPVSNMPSGILNTLTRDQVLDLLAYLLTEGNPAGSAFKK